NNYFSNSTLYQFNVIPISPDNLDQINRHIKEFVFPSSNVGLINALMHVDSNQSKSWIKGKIEEIKKDEKLLLLTQLLKISANDRIDEDQKSFISSKLPIFEGIDKQFYTLSHIKSQPQINNRIIVTPETRINLEFVTILSTDKLRNASYFIKEFEILL